MHEAEFSAFPNGREIREISSVGERVQDQDPIAWVVVQPVVHEVCTDESRAAGDQQPAHGPGIGGIESRVALSDRAQCSGPAPNAATVGRLSSRLQAGRRAAGGGTAVAMGGASMRNGDKAGRPGWTAMG